MVAKPKRRLIKPKRRAAAKARRTKTVRRRGRVSVDSFVLNAFIEAMRAKGYPEALARARAKELLDAPGFAGFPSPDEIDKS